MKEQGAEILTGRAKSVSALVMIINRDSTSFVHALAYSLHLKWKIVIEACCSVLNVLHVLSFLSVFSLTKNEHGNDNLIGISLTMRIHKYSSSPEFFQVVIP